MVKGSSPLQRGSRSSLKKLLGLNDIITTKLDVAACVAVSRENTRWYGSITYYNNSKVIVYIINKLVGVKLIGMLQSCHPR